MPSVRLFCLGQGYHLPPANQREAWRDVEVIERDVEHYDGGLFDRLLSGEEDVWTKP